MSAPAAAGAGGAASGVPRSTWRKPPLIRRRRDRIALGCLLATYLVLALGTLQVDGSRLADGLARGAAFAMAFAAPDFLSHLDDMLAGFAESLAMTVTSTAVGVALAVPLAVGASSSLAPRSVHLPCRAFVAIARSLNEIIVAILLVVLFGFGPFTGFLTLTFATVAFMAKLLAEHIELLDPAPLEALAAAGAGFPQRLVYAVLPQVMPRFLGLSLYRLDINFRESAVIGIVGAGGIGTTLHTAMDRYEYSTASAIVLLIVAIVLSAEFLSGMLRRRLL